MKKGRESALSQLKYPLVFYGLALVAVEAAFGTRLAANSDSELLVIFLSSLMGFLFFFTILVVSFLVYKVPDHVMLKAQEQLLREEEELKRLGKGLAHSVSLLKQQDDPKMFIFVLDEVRKAIEVMSGKTGTDE